MLLEAHANSKREIHRIEYGKDNSLAAVAPTLESAHAGAGGGIVDRVAVALLERAADCEMDATVAREGAVRFFDTVGLSASD